MGTADFLAQLRGLGLEVTEVASDKVTFPYEVPVGPRTGEALVLGFVLPGDFPLTCPSGPHVSPALFPIKSGGEHPTGGVHVSEAFGDGFQYWSRPFAGWAKSGRTAGAYMGFIRGLFATL